MNQSLRCTIKRQLIYYNINFFISLCNYTIIYIYIYILCYNIFLSLYCHIFIRLINYIIIVLNAYTHTHLYIQIK